MGKNPWKGAVFVENIVYGTSVTPEEYNRLRMAVGWYELSPRQARDGLAHTPFVACARVDGVCVAMGRALFDFGYTVYLGDVVVDPAWQGKGIGRRIVENLCQAVLDAADPGDTLMFFLSAARGKEPFYEKLGFETNPNATAGSGMRKTITKA